MKKNNYDIVVLGSNLSSLITASFLCKNGHRVLVIENKDKKWVNSQFFDNNATTFISGCGQNKLLYNIFRELSIPIHHQKKFKVNELSYQIALPELRIDVGSSWNLYYQEIKREFFKHIGQIGHVYGEIFKCDKLLNDVFYSHLLYPQNLGSKLKSNFIMHLESLFRINEETRDLSNIISGDFKSTLFKNILKLQADLLSNASNNMSSMTTLFLLSAFQRGMIKEPDKLSALMHILKEQIIKTHGEFLSVDKIDSIQVSKRSPLKDKKGIMINLDGNRRLIEGKVLVCGQPLFSLPKSLTGISFSSRFKRLVKRFIPKSAKLTFTYGIDRWGIPVGLRSRVLFVPDKSSNAASRRSGKKPNEILVTISQEKIDGASVNSYLLKGTVKEPFRNGMIKSSRLKELYDETTAGLKELIPFYDDFVKPVSNQDFKDIKLDDLKDGDFIYDSSFLKNLSLGEVESCEILKNVYFTGKEFLPQMGFEGEIISGWRTANVIIEKFK